MARDPRYRQCSELDREFLDSVVGTASACKIVSEKLTVLKKTTAGCLSLPLDVLIRDFSSMNESYNLLSRALGRIKRIWSPEATDLIRSTQLRCQEITTQVSKVVESYTEWDVLASESSIRSLNTSSTHLTAENTHLGLLISILSLAKHLSHKPAAHESPDSVVVPPAAFQRVGRHGRYADPHNVDRRRLEAAQFAARCMEDWSRDCKRSFSAVRRTLEFKKAAVGESPGSQSTGRTPQDKDTEKISEELPDADDRSSTQSTIGTMIPGEDQSDMGSDATVKPYTPAITGHSLQLCGYYTVSFLKLLEHIERSMGSFPYGMPSYALEESVDAESFERLSQAYEALYIQLIHGLDVSVPSQGRSCVSLSAQTEVTRGNLRLCIKQIRTFLGNINHVWHAISWRPGHRLLDNLKVEAVHSAYDALTVGMLENLGSAPALAPKGLNSSIYEDWEKDFHVDKVLEIFIDSMESTPTDKDIMKLVFHWTNLDECNDFKRADVMKLN